MNTLISPAAAGAADMLAAVLNQIEVGVLISDASGGLLHANREAQTELDRGTFLRLGTPQDPRQLCVLTECGPSAWHELRSAIEAAARHGRRRMVALRACGKVLLLTAVSLTGAGGERRALLLLGRRRPCSQLGLEMFATTHGLTPAETRVLAGLLEGAKPDEIARQASVAISTLRTQLSSLRAKLDAHRVEELLLRVAEIPPMAGALQA